MRELPINFPRNMQQRAAPGHLHLGPPKSCLTTRKQHAPDTLQAPASWLCKLPAHAANQCAPPPSAPSQLMFICPLIIKKVLALARMCKLRTRSLRTWTVTMAGLALLEGSQIFTFGRESRNHIIWEPITQGIATGMPSQVRKKGLV